MTEDLKELLGIARTVVARAGDVLGTADPGTVHAKGDRDFVTDLDRGIEDRVRRALDQHTTEFGFLGEESEDAPADPTVGYVWTLDPIDGTSNFIHGIPLCAVSLALLRNGTPVLGVIAAPFLEVEYYAAAGHGAFRNDVPIRASSTQSLGQAIVSIGDYATGDNATELNRRRLAITATLAANIERVRMVGSAALDLAWVADGRLDACVSLSNKPWDTAAGVIIARESGAIVTDAAGSPHTFTSDSTVAVTAGLATQLGRLISR